MPNYVRNIVKFKDITWNRFKEILKEINGDGDVSFSFDFNKIIPMPKSLDIEESSRGEKGYACYKAYLEEIESKMDKSEKEEIKARLMKEHKLEEGDFELGKTYFENVQNYGATSWYQWCIDHWDTKWNSMYSCVQENGVISFETAWSTPEKVIKEMAKKFNVGIEVDFADEDIGYNCGIYEYNKDGELINEINMNCDTVGEEKARKFACEIWDEEYECDETEE